MKWLSRFWGWIKRMAGIGPPPIPPSKSTIKHEAKKATKNENGNAKAKQKANGPKLPNKSSAAPQSSNLKVQPTIANTKVSGFEPNVALEKRTPAIPRQPPLIIGLDFGTSSTKILIRQRGDTKCRVVTVDDPADNYPWFAVPSLVRIEGERLYFGREALCRSGGELFKSLKVRLLSECRDNSATASTEPTKTDYLVAAFLIWVLDRVKKQVEILGNPPVRLNLAAPMDHFENPELKQRYLKIVNATWQSVWGAKPIEPSRIETLVQWTDHLRPLFNGTIQDISERQFEVFPETISPIVSVSMDPQMGPGMYQVFDMGAGTTEISINHVRNRNAEQSVACYVDKSTIIGGDDFEAAELLNDVNRLQAKHIELVARQKKAFNLVWALGFEKDAHNPVCHPRWKQLTVILTGGAARRREIEEKINAEHPIWLQTHSKWEIDYDVIWHRPSNIVVSKTADWETETDFSFLAVAHGLTVERAKWPKIYFPEDVGFTNPPEWTPPAPSPWGNDY